MQPSEMRTFRFLYHKKEFLTLIKPKPISTSNVTFFTSTKIARFSHHRPCPVRRNVHNGRNSFESKINRNQSLRFFGSDEAGSALNEESPRVSSGVSDEAGYAPNDENPRVSSGDWGKLNRNIEKSVPNSSFQYRSGSNFNGKGQFNKKKGKTKVSWVCSDCGGTFSQWWGDCKYCKASGTIKAFKESDGDSKQSWGVQLSEKVVGSWLPHSAGEHTPQRLTDVNKGIDRSTWRITLPGTFGAEVARVLGGGLVPGSLVLVGGDPGVGKSTLLLQLSAMIAEGNGFGGPAPVLYVSGEESIQQIANRADRMRITTEELFLYSSTDIEDILENVRPLIPRALVVDSIQTAYLKAATGSAGSIVQVKECTSALLRLAKKTGIPVFVSGHVTKTGDIGGPRVLEHIVDVVLYMEGEKYSAHRFLRSVKNRFGSTDELGVFEMSECGLQAVSNPSEIFLSEQNSDSDVLTGLAVAVMIDGSRTFLIEIQALCIADSSTSRHINGIDQRRTDMIISVLSKQAGLKLQDNAIFVNVVTGVKLNETAGDLAIAAAICSSFLEFPIPNHFAFIGEIGLGGELRSVPRMEKRMSSLAKLGYKRCVVPKSAEKSLAALKLEGIELVGCKNLKEMINTVFVMP